MSESNEAAWKAIGGAMREHEAVTEEMLEELAWQRWLAMAAFYPRDSYRPGGMGQG